jgi:DNA-directed RNA polymerase beta' subunit
MNLRVGDIVERHMIDNDVVRTIYMYIAKYLLHTYIHTYIHTYRCCSIGSHFCIRCLSWRIELKCFYHDISIQRYFISTYIHTCIHICCLRVCLKPYNSDFDDDEMNMHLPQTEEAKAEVRHKIHIPIHTYSTYIHTYTQYIYIHA